MCSVRAIISRCANSLLMLAGGMEWGSPKAEVETNGVRKSVLGIKHFFLACRLQRGPNDVRWCISQVTEIPGGGNAK